MLYYVFFVYYTLRLRSISFPYIYRLQDYTYRTKTALNSHRFFSWDANRKIGKMERVSISIKEIIFDLREEVHVKFLWATERLKEMKFR